MTRLKSLFADNRTATLFVLLCILAVYGISYSKRQAGYHDWLESPSEYVVEHVTSMSTTDAYFWLKMAREMDEGKLEEGQPDPLRGYPDLENYPDSPSLLARFISISSRFTEGDYYRAGILLVPILSGLFVLPLFLYFHSLGFGASAVLGGLIGSFSVSYHSRSNHGYVDTDMLNTFFPIMVSALIVLINRERSFRANLLLAVGAGATMYLFNWWYQQPVFFLVYLLFIAAYLFLLRFPWKESGLLLLAFTLASGPQYVLESVASVQVFLNAYFFPKLSGQIVWPDILTTITEAQKQDLTTNLRRLHGFLPIVFAGLAGLITLFALRWKRLLPIAPLILIGLWSLTGPRRFSMYLAPFIGIGVGVLIELLVRKIGERLQLRPLVLPVVSVALMAAVFFSTTGYTAYNVIPGAIPTAATTKAILDIKKLVPKHSAMLTWWDSGYPLMDIGEFATYHDGALHGYSRTTLVAKALTAQHQDEMVSLLSYLEDYGFDVLNERIVKENHSGNQMMNLVFNHPAQFRGENVYILYFEDMIKKFGGLSIFGTWDFDRKKSDPMRYEYMTCFSQTDKNINCKGATVDLDRGIIRDETNEVQLKAVLFVNDGYVANHFNYPHPEGYYLQILMKQGQPFEVQVLEERLFRTNFNQQYLLGNYDRRYFEEVYNNFPVARVLKVKNVGTEEESK